MLMVAQHLVAAARQRHRAQPRKVCAGARAARPALHMALFQRRQPGLRTYKECGSAGTGVQLPCAGRRCRGPAQLASPA